MDGNHGAIHPKTTDFVSAGIPFITAADIGDSRVDTSNCKFITAELASILRKGFARAGDVLLTHKGTIGRTAIVPALSVPFLVLTPQVTYYRVTDEAQLDRRFLKYYFDSRLFQDVLHAWSNSGSTRAYLGITSQLDLPVWVPEIGEQRAISRVLGALDDKIDLNRELNRTLEETAQALFRSWFVDFDPVVAMADGRKPFGMSDEVAALFPSHFEKSDLGPIPEGWMVSTIGKEVEVVGGSTPSTTEPRYWEPGEYCWATPKDLAGLREPVLLSTEHRVSSAGLHRIGSGLLPRGTVLLSSRAPIGYLAVAEVPTAVNQGFIAMMCTGRLSNRFILRWTEANMDEVTSRAGGTTFAEISKSGFRPIPIVVPSARIHTAWNRLADPLHQAIVANVKESRTLAALRDLLLPRLLSGEIRVRQAQQAVEASL